MNEQENTRLVQRAYQSIQAGDFQVLLDSFAEDVQWQLPEMENVPFAGTWRGREGIRQFLAKFSNCKMSSNLSHRNTSPKATKWLCWGVS
jgi:hypothetical protein